MTRAYSTVSVRILETIHSCGCLFYCLCFTHIFSPLLLN